MCTLRSDVVKYRAENTLSGRQLDSPHIDTDKPVSRQQEVDLLGYYGHPQLLGWSLHVG
jgi:hypothetical protein